MFASLKNKQKNNQTNKPPKPTPTKIQPACNWHKLFSFAGFFGFATHHKWLQNYFKVLSKRQQIIIALLKVSTLYPKPWFSVSTTCWLSYQPFPVFQTITSSFSEERSPSAHLWIHWTIFKVKSMFDCTEFASRHRNPDVWLGEVTSHITLLCQRSTSVSWGAESVKCFRTNKTCFIMYSY